MADYKELLRRAIKALPENNGAARRAVYEKARSALVAQLRAISPPLPTKDITQHRLQLEDCIRFVEQETSEALLARSMDEGAARALGTGAGRSAPNNQAPAGDSRIEDEGETGAPAEAGPGGAKQRAEVASQRVPEQALPNQRAHENAAGRRGGPEGGSIEDIIAEAERSQVSTSPPATMAAVPVQGKEKAPEPAPGSKPEPARTGARPLPSIVARAEAARTSSPQSMVAANQGNRNGGAPSMPSQDGRAAAVSMPMDRPASGNRAAVARKGAPEPFAASGAAVAPALSSVREVDLEHPIGEVKEAEGAIHRAIAALDREARGETPADEDVIATPVPFPNSKGGDRRAALENAFRPATRPEATPARARGDGAGRAGGNALSIFLIVFVVLLAGTGGAGYWAWNEGYLDVEALLGRTGPVVEANVDAAQQPAQQTAEAPVPANTNGEAGPGNTESAVPSVEPTVALSTEDRLPPTIDPATETANAAATATPADGPLALVEPSPGSTLTVGPSSDEVKTEERLPGSDTAAAPDASAVAATDPAALAGTQSLLLEASEGGTTGAVPFSGTVEWSRGTDETGQPTLIGKANIPARNLSVGVLIRRNTDPILPASHLMEIDFSVSETFIGGSIVQVPGVLLKNEELVQGTPLVGASARVVGNSFLFALSASPEDSATNNDLLTTRKWIDLAVIYATGKRAIITLEKDEAAQAMFTEVFAAWAQQAAAGN